MKTTSFTIENAPESVLREWLKQKYAKEQEQRDDHWLGWWLVRNAQTITVTMPWGATLTVNGATAVPEVRRWIDEGQQHANWRAA